VLLVEDNDPDVYVIRELLLRCPVPIDLHIVPDGVAALAYLEDERNACPELVLLDLNLPKLGGIEVLRRMRSGPRCGQTPVIVVSSSDTDADRNASKNLGAQAYFRKPSDLKTYSNLANIVLEFLPAKGEA
jgi:two-component system, chemotaxis family, response regulator Rcp1